MNEQAILAALENIEEKIKEVREVLEDGDSSAYIIEAALEIEEYARAVRNECD